jgi:anthranilate synthase/aminodeoxychorismate synthase-like glutamine amidotransferase
MHGKVSTVQHDGKGVYAGIAQEFAAGRYHSLIAEPASVPAVLEVTARTSSGEIMGVRHRTLPIEGVQFHPESVLTPDGPALMGNFLKG